MKLIVAASIALACLTGSAFAGTFKVPEDKPIASVTIPDSWKPHPYDGGVEGTSPDNTTYIAVDVVKADDLNGAVVEALKSITKAGVELDPDSAKQESFKLNGLDFVELTYSGKDKGEAATVSLAIGPLTETQFLFISYWGTPAGEAANKDDLAKIATSFKKIGG